MTKPKSQYRKFETSCTQDTVLGMPDSSLRLSLMPRLSRADPSDFFLSTKVKAPPRKDPQVKPTERSVSIGLNVVSSLEGRLEADGTCERLGRNPAATGDPIPAGIF